MKRRDHTNAVFEVRDTARYGKGVFATSDIKAGSVIHILTGVTITIRELVNRVNSGNERIDDPLQVGMRTYIDLDSLSRTFNHSCAPNAGLRRRSTLFALRHIQTGEEITYDYSTTIAPTIWQMRCRCGSMKCRKLLGDVRSIPHTQLSRYKSIGAVQRYMKTLLAKRGWRRNLPQYEISALNALVKTSENE